jgi:Tfp pilus assembly protein PilZ
MQHLRRHQRYGLDLINVKGKMSLSEKVEILDISLGGVALKVDRRLNPGRDYMIKLQDKENTLNVMGRIVRSEFSGTVTRDDGENVSIYAASMQFQDGSTDRVAVFLKSIVPNKQKGTSAPVPVERRLNVRAHTSEPRENILCYPANFRVLTISLSGMLIQSEQALEIGSIVPMGLPLNNGTMINFTGRVVSCRPKEEKGQTNYDIGAEFISLVGKDKVMLQLFIDQWTTMEDRIANEKARSGGRI